MLTRRHALLALWLLPALAMAAGAILALLTGVPELAVEVSLP